MSESYYTGQGTILGGLPIIATVWWGTDYWGEGFAEIEHIYWMKRDGTKGKEITRKVYDRAEKYDPDYCSLIEQLNDNAAGPPDTEMVQFEGGPFT